MKVKGKNSEVGPRITQNSQFRGKYNPFPKLSIEAAADVAVFETARTNLCMLSCGIIASAIYYTSVKNYNSEILEETQYTLPLQSG